MINQKSSLDNTKTSSKYDTDVIEVSKTKVKPGWLRFSELKYIISRFNVNHKFSLDNLDMRLFELAFTHSSVYLENTNGSQYNNLHDYNVLECFGDSVIDLASIEYIYYKYPECSEMLLTDIKSIMVNNNSLGQLSKKYGLDRYLKVNLEKLPGESKIYADVFEAFIGACYLGFGKQNTMEFIYNILGNEFDNIDYEKYKQEMASENYKNMLAKEKKNQIKYELIEKLGKDNEPIFKVAVVDYNGNTLGTGSGRSKKIAEQNAAKMALNID